MYSCCLCAVIRKVGNALRKCQMIEKRLSTKEDLKLPSGTDDLNKLQEELKKAFDDGKDMIMI